MQGTASLEDRLLRRAGNGDHDAMASLLARHGPAVRAVIRGRIPRALRPLLTEDDVMQETYVEAFLSIGGCAPGSSFRAWLTRIAKNNLLDGIKGLKSRRRGRGWRRIEAPPVGGDPLVSLVELLTASQTSPSRTAGRHEWQEIVGRAVEQLPAAYRDAVKLYDLASLPIEEVAARLGCSSGAVYMRRARAHRMLRDLLEILSHDA